MVNRIYPIMSGCVLQKKQSVLFSFQESFRIPGIKFGTVLSIRNPTIKLFLIAILFVYVLIFSSGASADRQPVIWQTFQH